jgi:hypothetical protein
MRPEELQKLAFARHKRNADSWYECVLEKIRSEAESGFFSYKSTEFYDDGSFREYGETNPTEFKRVIDQLKAFGLSVKIKGEEIEISWKK